jgi:hypothetical protein
MYRRLRVDDLLFNSGYLRDALAQQAERMVEEIKRAPEDHLLHVDVDAWTAALSERYGLEAPELAPEEDWYQDEPAPVQVDVSHEHLTRAISDPSTPTYIDGYRVTVRIPFTGDPEIFELQPSTYTLNPPRGAVRGNELTQTVEYPHDRPADIAGAARGLANSVATYLRSAHGDIATINAGLEAQARGAIETRRKRILAHREHVAATGLPTRKREDRETTYVADAIVRRPAPPLESRPLDEPMRLEPVLAERVFEDVLGVLRSACVSMERSPGTYAAMGEEDRRQVLLIPLNTQYRTGERGGVQRHGQDGHSAEVGGPEPLYRRVQNLARRQELRRRGRPAVHLRRLARHQAGGRDVRRREEPDRNHRQSARGTRRARAVRGLGRG